MFFLFFNFCNVIYLQKAPEPVFKVPQANPPVALRKTSTAAAPQARKGMLRPSSGYYGSSSSAASTKSTDSLNSLNEVSVFILLCTRDGVLTV